MLSLKFYKTRPEAHIPQFGTSESACFDVCASIRWEDSITYYSEYGDCKSAYVALDNSLVLYPGSRYLIPTNLIFDIPRGYSVRAHPRSGLSLRSGISLFNCEGIIDSDYVNPVFITLYNFGARPFTLHDGDRVAQMELVPQLVYSLETTDAPPNQKTDRAGGFGSTGV